jgi:hypothetical protein
VTNPKLSRETDNGRYYEDPLDGQLVVSVTNTLNEWAIPALAPGAAKETAEYILDYLPKAVRASRNPADRDAFLKDAKGHYKTVWEKKANLGTRIHTRADARNLGRPVADDPETAPYVAQYEQFLDDFGVDLENDIEFSEVTVLRRTAPRYGGTADIMVHLRFPADLSPQDPRFQGRKASTRQPILTPSGLWMIDIKTSMTKPASAVYRDNVLQLAALRFADVALLPDETERPVPPFVGAAILNLRRDSYGFVPLPADEAAHAAFLAMVPIAHFSHALDLTPCKPVAAPYKTTAQQKRGAA